MIAGTVSLLPPIRRAKGSAWIDAETLVFAAGGTFPLLIFPLSVLWSKRHYQSLTETGDCFGVTAAFGGHESVDMVHLLVKLVELVAQAILSDNHAAWSSAPAVLAIPARDRGWPGRSA
jgi:hypothetical protein